MEDCPNDSPNSEEKSFSSTASEVHGGVGVSLVDQSEEVSEGDVADAEAHGKAGDDHESPF